MVVRSEAVRSVGMGWKQIRSGIGVRVCSDDFAKLQKGVAYEVLFSGQKRRQRPSCQRVYIFPCFLYHVFVFACIPLLADLPFLDFQP